MKDTPIITSLLEPDFYKFTMGQFVWRRYPDVLVASAFRNRTKNVHLGSIVDVGELREELDHVRTLRFTNSELHYLRGTNEYGERMFCEPYLQFLKGLRLPEYLLEKEGDNLHLEFDGLWPEQIYWETIALSVVNELYARKLMKPLTWFERDVVYANGRTRLMQKIKTLREHPGIRFSDFGSRRRFSGEWQAYVDEVLRDELPSQFLGTSNTYLANRTGVIPMGTSAHELQMVVAGLHDGSGDDDWLRKAQCEVTEGWWKEYGEGLSIFLPDTFGSAFFLENLTRKDLLEWKGFRQDSKDPFEFGETILAEYQNHDIDAKEKLLIPSDGLTLPVILELEDRFAGRIKVSYGWGTNLTNDLFDNVWQNGLWYGPLSLVVKPIRANGNSLVKLSDNLAKATGNPEDVERYKVAAGYTNTDRVECVY
jgi:nicotinate phosphoribosyltransferase